MIGDLPETVFVDSNVPMYLVGGLHPHKTDARRILEEAVSSARRLVTDAEVLQEICHRYAAIERRDAIQPAFDALLGVVDDVLPVTLEDVEGAKDLLLGRPRGSSRDALHVAVMKRHDIKVIMSFDRGVDTYPAIQRIS